MKTTAYWYNQEPNFGDMLTTDIFHKVFNISVEHASPQKCDICGIGSILELFFTDSMPLKKRIKKLFEPPVIVWGSGFIKPEQNQKYIPIRKMDIRAVRGKITLERIQKYIKTKHAVVLGDPGLLCSRIIDTHNINKKYELGIIPHYVDSKNPYLNNIRVKNSVIIDIKKPVEQVLEQIAQCRCIISSAMHGLIAADSFGIPNIRMVLSDNIVGGDYKYDDYYSAFGITNHPRIIFDKDTIITSTDFIQNQYKITPHMVNQICNNLIMSLLLNGEKK